MIRLRRRIRINAEGKGLYGFINSLHSNGIACFGQYCRDDVFYGDIYRSDLKRVCRLAAEQEIELKTAEYPTLFGFLSRYRKRFGIIIGIIAAFLGCVYFSQVVVTIEIQGNERISDTAVLSALSELDIHRGKRIRDLDLHYCENELEIMMDDIAWAGIRRTGNRIVVQVKETVEKPEMLHERIPCNIVSAKDAVITYISVHKGVAVRKKGDFVPEGTLIISGISQNDRGRMSLHHADGVVLGRYTETIGFTQRYSSERYVLSGRIKKARRLRLFSVDIPIFSGRSSFESFENETAVRYFHIFGKVLPIGIVTETMTETVLTDTPLSEEETDRILMEKLYLYEKNFLSDCKVVKRDVIREKDSDSMSFRAVYKLEGDICRQREIFVK